MPIKAFTSEPSACAFGRRRALGTTSLIVAAAALFSIPAGAQAANAPAITINGTAAHAAQAERNSRVFVPAQSVFKQLGEVVTYTAPLAVVKTKSGVELARMTVGSREATLKGAAQTLAAAPFTSNTVLMVPLRFVSEAAGASVTYSANPRTIDIHKAMSVAAVGAAAAAGAAAVVAQANPAPQATDAATAAPAAVATQAESGGIPWWVWPLAALVLLGLIFAFLRRKKEPIIVTSGTGSDAGPTIVTRR